MVVVMELNSSWLQGFASLRVVSLTKRLLPACMEQGNCNGVSVKVWDGADVASLTVTVSAVAGKLESCSIDSKNAFAAQLRYTNHD